MDLVEARRNLQAESDKLDILSATLGVVCDDVEVVWSEGTSLLVARAVEIMGKVRQLKRNALRAGVNQSSTIAHSHFGDIIDLEAMSHNYTHGYEVHEQDLADRIEGKFSHRGVVS